MMNRIEHLSKKKDMERLKQMTGAAGGEEGSERERKKRGAKKSAPAAAKVSAVLCCAVLTECVLGICRVTRLVCYHLSS